MKRFKQLHGIVAGLEGDFEKFFDKQNKAAGTRIRKGMQELKQIAQAIRLEVQAAKNTDGDEPSKTAAPKKK